MCLSDVSGMHRAGVHTTTVTQSHSKKLIHMLKKFDRHWQNLVKQGDGGWMAKVNQYLREVLDNTKAKMDVVKYWQVSFSML